MFTIKPKTAYLGKEHLIIMCVAIGLVIHLIDEILHNADITPTPVLIFSAIMYGTYPFYPQLVRGLLAIALSIGTLMGLSGGHFIPFLQEGNTNGLITAIIGGLIAVSVIVYGIALIIQSSRKRN